MPVRSVDEQLALILSGAVRPAPVRVPIAEAHGLRSAEEVIAGRPLPGFDQAAVDGYAIRSVDLAGASEQTPAVLPVVGEIPAGSRHPLRLQPGQAVRVVAGAPLPTLADAVVPVGHTDAGTAKLTVTRGVPGPNLRIPSPSGRPDPEPPRRLLGRNVDRVRCASRHALTLLPPIGSAPADVRGHGVPKGARRGVTMDQRGSRVVLARKGA